MNILELMMVLDILPDNPLQEGENGCGNCKYQSYEWGDKMTCGRPGEFDPFRRRFSNDICDHWESNTRRDD